MPEAVQTASEPEIDPQPARFGEWGIVAQGSFPAETRRITTEDGALASVTVVPIKLHGRGSQYNSEADRIRQYTFDHPDHYTAVPLSSDREFVSQADIDEGDWDSLRDDSAERVESTKRGNPMTDYGIVDLSKPVEITEYEWTSELGEQETATVVYMVVEKRGFNRARSAKAAIDDEAEFKTTVQLNDMRGL